jgi:hypothetical protein
MAGWRSTRAAILTLEKSSAAMVALIFLFLNLRRHGVGDRVRACAERAWGEITLPITSKPRPAVHQRLTCLVSCVMVPGVALRRSCVTYCHIRIKLAGTSTDEPAFPATLIELSV